MITMTIAIVDDDEVDRLLLENLIKKAASSQGITMNIHAFTNGASFIDAANGMRFDIVFMDIFMKDTDGITTAKTFRTKDFQAPIVFLTASPEHREGAFSVHAFDYIEKPVQEAALLRVLNDIRRILPQADQPSLTLTAHKQEYEFPYSDIQYVISDMNYIKLFTKQELRFRANFSETESQLLQDPRFFALNRGIVINLDWVESVNYDFSLCTMKSKTDLPIARRKVLAFKNKIYGRIPSR